MFSLCNYRSSKKMILDKVFGVDIFELAEVVFSKKKRINIA